MLESHAVLERAASLKEKGIAFALVTVVRCESPTSAKPGAKAVVEADGEIQGWVGGGCAQPAVIKTAKQALEDGQSRLIRISPAKNEVIEAGITDFGMSCHSGGTLDIFIDPVIPKPVLLIIGGSPAAQTLCALAQRVGFAVTAAFPGADSSMFADAEQIIDGLDVGTIATPSFVVVATQGKRDEPGLEAALSTGSPYIAFIASERKAAKLKDYLRDRGHQDELVDAIISPVGIEIDPVTPEEIALSVLAGLVKARRNGMGVVQTATVSTKAAESSGSCCGGAKADDSEKQAANAEAIDPVCQMSVDIASAEYKSEFEGQMYYFCCAGCQHSFDKEPKTYLQATVSV